MKFRNFTAFLLCILIFFTSALSVGADAASIPNAIDTEDGEYVAYFYDQLLDYVIRHYKYDITKEELLSAAVNKLLTDHPEYLTELGKGMFDALDENSTFYTAEEFTDVYADVSGVYVGIGIHVSQDGTKIVLGEPIEGSPAEGSGLQVGDVIIAVDGEDVTDYALDKVTSMIKGEAGTSVSITVLRNSIEYTYDLTRAEIRINPITYYTIDGADAGYVKISAFNASTEEAFDDAMKYFSDNGISNIVLDLRNNIGGYLNAAVAVASYFVPDGSVVVTEEHKDEKKNKSHYSKDTDNKFKAVVLVNEYSASASEVVSSALRDYGTGTLVGKRTYGKGTVQDTIHIRSDHYLWLTVAEYYTPSHTPIHKVGLEPDYYVTNTTEKFDMSTLTKYDILRVLNIGDTGEDVRAVKERLKILGYQITVDDVYDEKTADIVTKFQTATELFPYGTADITTQVKINDVIADSNVTVDNQYEKAVELVKNLK